MLSSEEMKLLINGEDLAEVAKEIIKYKNSTGIAINISKEEFIKDDENGYYYYDIDLTRYYETSINLDYMISVGKNMETNILTYVPLKYVSDTELRYETYEPYNVRLMLLYQNGNVLLKGSSARYTISENQDNKDGVYKLDFKCYDKDNVLVDSFTTINLVSNKYEIKPDVNNNSYSYVLDIIERGEDGDNVIKTPNLMGSNILFGLELSGKQEKIYKEIVNSKLYDVYINENNGNVYKRTDDGGENIWKYITSIKGKDGVSIKNIELKEFTVGDNTEKHLVFTLEDDSQIDVGVIPLDEGGSISEEDVITVDEFGDIWGDVTVLPYQ